MKEHPILFSAPMIKALLENRKTVTRRLSKSWLKVKAGDRLWVREAWAQTESHGGPVVAYRAGGYLMNGAEGNRRLGTWREFVFSGEAGEVYEPERWKPSIHMPRWASRITLEATEDARIERLHDITEAEATAEGCDAVPEEIWYEGMKPFRDGSRVRQQSRGVPPESWTEVQPLEPRYDPLAHTARDDFRKLWCHLHSKPGERWEDNPELVRVAFWRIG